MAGPPVLRTLALAAALSCSRAPSSRDAGARIRDDAKVAEPALLRPALTIVHGSDLHGRDAPDGPEAAVPGGLSRRATLVDLARVSSDAVIQVDAGDFLPEPSDDPALGEAAALEHRAARVFAAYGRMGVDVITPGERELAFGVERLRAWLKENNVAAVAANLNDAAGEPLFEPDRLITRAGHTTGVFGVLDAQPSDTGATPPPYRIGDAAAAARRVARTLRERGAELVIALVHGEGGPGRLEEILGPSSEIDLVVLAHAPAGTPTSTHVGRTAVVCTGGAERSLGRVDVTWRAAGEPMRLRPELVPLARSVREHLGVGLLVAVDRDNVVRDQQAFLHPKKPAKGVPAPALFERWDYGGTEGCGFCHMDAVAQWKTTRHASAVATLQQEGRNKDAACLGCHLTGYLQPGGSQLLPIATAQFADVGCECCHGPSALHVRSINKKKGTTRAVARTVCLGCHTADRAAFDYEEAVKRVLGPGHGAH